MTEKKKKNQNMNDGDETEDQDLRRHLNSFSANWLMKKAEETMKQIIEACEYKYASSLMMEFRVS